MDDMEALGGRLVPMSSRLSNDKSAPRSLVSNFDFDKGEANIDDAEGPSGQVLSKSFERNLHENLFNSVPQGSDDHARRLSTLSDPDKSIPLQFLGIPLHKHMTKQDCPDFVDNVEEIGQTPYRQKVLLGFKDLYSLGGYEMQSLTKLQVDVTLSRC